MSATCSACISADVYTPEDFFVTAVQLPVGTKTTLSMVSMSNALSTSSNCSLDNSGLLALLLIVFMLDLKLSTLNPPFSNRISVKLPLATFSGSYFASTVLAAIIPSLMVAPLFVSVTTFLSYADSALDICLLKASSPKFLELKANFSSNTFCTFIKLFVVPSLFVPINIVCSLSNSFCKLAIFIAPEESVIFVDIHFATTLFSIAPKALPSFESGFILREP